MPHYMLDANGNPVVTSDITEWARWYENSEEERRVAVDDFDGVRVSTVFLANDLGFGGARPPLLYETMILGGNFSEYQERSCTREEALQVHAKALARVRRSLHRAAAAVGTPDAVRMPDMRPPYLFRED